MKTTEDIGGKVEDVISTDKTIWYSRGPIILYLFHDLPISNK